MLISDMEGWGIIYTAKRNMSKVEDFKVVFEGKLPLCLRCEDTKAAKFAAQCR